MYICTSDLPKLSWALCPAAREMAGTSATPEGTSKATLDPSESCNRSPFREKAICPRSRSRRQPITLPAVHCCPKLSLPLCHLHT